jgi:autotransporter translocation and assembly factor TamB
MKRGFRRILIAVPVAVFLCAFVGAAFYFRTAAFQARARAVLMARIEQSTGLRLSLGRFSIDVLRGTFSLSNLELKSKKTFAFSADQISGSFRITTLWRPKFELGELNLVRPHISITPQPGGAPWSIEPIMRRSLDVAARKTTLRDGWVQYNNRRIQLNLDLEGLDCGFQYRPDPQSYLVHLAYKNGSLLWSNRKFVYDLDAVLAVFRTGLEIIEFKLREDKSRFNGNGTLMPWNSPILNIHAVGALAGEDAVLLTPDLKEARGEVNVNCDLRVDGHDYRLNGSFRGKEISYRTSAAQNVSGLFDVQKDVLSLSNVQGHVGEGTFQLKGDVQLKASNKPPNHLDISAQGVLIKDGSGILDLRRLALENRVDAEVALEWKHGAGDLTVEGSVMLYGIPDALPGSETRTALQGRTEFFYRKNDWHIKRATVNSPWTSIQVGGIDAERAHVKASSSRPAEIFRMLRGFSDSLDKLFADNPDWMWIAGNYNLDGEFRIQHPDSFSYEGEASFTNGHWKTYTIDSVSGAAVWNGSRLVMHGMRATKGTQEARGDFRIDWAKGDVKPDFAFDGTLERISLASIGDFGLEWDRQITGVLAGQGNIAYEQGVFRGGGRLEVRDGSIAGQSFENLSTELQLSADGLRVTNARLKRGAASASADGRINLDNQRLQIAARLDDLPLTDIPEVKRRGVDIGGQISASGQIEGTLDMPEIADGRIEINGLNYAGRYFGKGTAAIELRDRTLSIDRIELNSDLGKFSGSARIRAEDDYPGTANLKFSDWNVKKLAADSVAQLAIFGDLDTALLGTLTIEGPFGDYSKLRYRGELDGARFTINGYRVQNDGPMSFSGNAEMVTVEQARLIGEGTSLAVEKGGAIPLAADSPNLNLQFNGRLNLKMLDHWADHTGVSGFADLRAVNISGSWRAPEIIGRATIGNTRLDNDNFPYPFSGLNGNVIFSRQLVRLDNIAGSVATGTIRVSGLVDVQNPDLPVINLQGTLRNVRLRYPKDFVSKIDAELSLTGSPGTFVLGGNVGVIRAEYLKDFNLLEQIVGGSSGSSGPSVSDSPFAGMRLKDISIRSQNGLYIDNELTRVQGGMNLTLHGTFDNPSVTGRVWATEGSIFFRGNRFDIINGAIDFVDRNRINPVLNIRAEADVRSYRVRMDVNGDLEHLHSHGLTISSDPALSQVDILSLLITGKSEDTAVTGTTDPRRQAEMTGLSAASILSEEMTGVVGKRVERIFGLSSFRVDPFLAGAENDPTARVTISERLSSDLAITYSRNLSTSQEQIVVLEYDVNKNLSIIATRDEDGKFGIDFRFRKRLR